jgi:hypothetical protein
VRPVKTIVYQSFRTSDVPPWVEPCLRSVREWAAARGFEYRFFDDSFFDFCPEWYRQRVERNILLMSDLARLVAARRLLDEGFERAIWVDADLLIFAPSALDLQTDEKFAFNTELWVNREQGKFVGRWRVNNAVCTFDRGNHFLDFYIDACERIVRQAQAGPIDRLSVGTKFLTALHQLAPLPLMRCVGTFNPILMEHLARGQLEPLRAYRQHLGHPIGAANLCGSFRGQMCQGVKIEDSIYEGTIRELQGPAGMEIGQ